MSLLRGKDGVLSSGAAGIRVSGASFLTLRPPVTSSTTTNGGSIRRRRGGALGVVAQPRAREVFTPRELAAAYERFMERGPQHVDAESRLGISAYRFGSRVLIAYEGPDTGVVVLMHLQNWKVDSPK